MGGSLDMDKTMFKMSSEELQSWIHNKHRTFILPNKKGKGSYSRKGKNKFQYMGSSRVSMWY